MGIFRKLQYNSPTILTFALISLVVLLTSIFANGAIIHKFFSVYRSSLYDPCTYIRFFGHVLGHANYDHFIGNMTLLLVIGPPLEERYGSNTILKLILATALISGLVQFIFFPNSALLGASGIVFMLIVLSSLSGASKGRIPLTLILVYVIYIGGEILNGVLTSDNVSQLTHIIGGTCGGIFGLSLRGGKH